jgi:peroxiredoxin
LLVSIECSLGLPTVALKMGHIIMKHLIFAGVLALATIATSWAQNDPAQLSAQAAADLGPAIGSEAPQVSATDAQGNAQTLTSLSGENGVVVYFNRSLDWCPICIRQTLDVDTASDQFDAKGWNLAVVTRDSVEALANAKDRRGFNIPLLADPDSELINAFGIADPIYADPEHRAHGVPYPIAVAIDPDGEVVGKFWHEAGFGNEGGYRTRVTPQDVLNALP